MIIRIARINRNQEHVLCNPCYTATPLTRYPETEDDHFQFIHPFNDEAEQTLSCDGCGTPVCDARVSPRHWYLRDETDELLCEGCWMGRGGGDPETESALCLYEDYHWEQYSPDAIPQAADRTCDHCGRNIQLDRQAALAV